MSWHVWLSHVTRTKESRRPPDSYVVYFAIRILAMCEMSCLIESCYDMYEWVMWRVERITNGYLTPANKCSVLQCDAVWCRVLQCVAVCCSALQCVAVCCRGGMLQCVALCCSVLQCVAVCCSVLQCVAVSCGMFVVSCGKLQRGVLCCRFLQCIAAYAALLYLLCDTAHCNTL